MRRYANPEKLLKVMLSRSGRPSHSKTLNAQLICFLAVPGLTWKLCDFKALYKTLQVIAMVVSP